MTVLKSMARGKKIRRKKGDDIPNISIRAPLQLNEADVVLIDEFLHRTGPSNLCADVGTSMLLAQLSSSLHQLGPTLLFFFCCLTFTIETGQTKSRQSLAPFALCPKRYKRK